VEEKREREWIRRRLCCRWGEKGRHAREKRNRGEREKRFPKDLCTISENCRDLFVKQNFPLI
jgi:hypothetical protein